MVARPGEYGGLKVLPVRQAALEQGSFILLYSKAGDGKTTLAGSLNDSPEDCPMMVIDMEGGTKVIQHREGIEVIPVTSWAEWVKIRDALLKDAAPPWKTIVIDNLSELAGLAIKHFTKGDQTTQPEWGQIGRGIIDSCLDLRNTLARKRGVNLLLIGWEMFEKDEMTGRAVWTLTGTPMIQRELPGKVDHIGRITSIEGQPAWRSISFESSPRTISKMRRANNTAGMSVPLKIDYTLGNLPLPDIMNALVRGVEFPKNKYKDAPAPVLARA